MTEYYGDDLAYIHDAGYTGLGRSAAGVLLEALRQVGWAGGRVVDLGCGSGVVAARLSAAGYDVLGIDLSTAMIALARQRAPRATFQVGSLLDVDLPPCVAVAAIGECLNFLFVTDNTDVARGRLFERIYRALTPGGLFLFDVATPGRVPGPGPARLHAEGPDWAVLVTAEEEATQRRLIRRITSFRKMGELYRRSHEVHQLHLLPEEEVIGELRVCGFQVQTLPAYGEMTLAAGHRAFLAVRS